jgi:PEP-CTERM motif
MKASLLLLLFVAVPLAHGQGFVFDQQSPLSSNKVFAEGGFFLTTGQPIGQSFTPALSSIGFVFLQLNDFNPNNGTGAVVLVKLFSGSLTNGTLIGTTIPVVLPDGFGATIGGFGETNLLFTTSVSLTPGIQYFLQPVLQSGDPGFYVGADFLGYSGGTAYANGVPVSRDLWFREGIIATPEPSTLTLAALGGLLFGFRRR